MKRKSERTIEAVISAVTTYLYGVNNTDSWLIIDSMTPQESVTMIAKLAIAFCFVYAMILFISYVFEQFDNGKGQN